LSFLYWLEIPQQAISDSRFYSKWYESISSRRTSNPLSVGEVNSVVRAGQRHGLIPKSGFRFERHSGRHGWHMQFAGGGSSTLGNRHLPINRASFTEAGWTISIYQTRVGERGSRLRPPVGGGSSLGRAIGWVGMEIVVLSSIPEIASAAEEGEVGGAASAAGGIGKNLIYDTMIFVASGGASAPGQMLGGVLSANAPAEFDPMFAAIRENPEGLHAARGSMSTGCYEYLCARTGVQSQNPDYSLPRELEGHVARPIFEPNF